MKCRVLQTVLITVFTGIFLPVLGQKNYYVVVGAFSTEGNAKEFTTHLPSMNVDTAYAMNDNQSLVHLYVLKTTDESVAMAKSLELQRSIEEGHPSGDFESIAVTNRPEGKVITYKEAIDPVEENSGAGSSRSATYDGSVPAAPVNVKGKLFKFTISNQAGQLLPGAVHYVDFEQQRDLASYTASSYTDIINPGKNSEMTLVCGLFGYKFSEKFVNYSIPSATEGAYQDENGAWVIPYTLERLEKGDVSVMYNVAFHENAVVMLPHSKGDEGESQI
jgi:hypothetical protein